MRSLIFRFFLGLRYFLIIANFDILIIANFDLYITLYHQYRCFYDKKWKLPNENQYLSLLCGQHGHICV